MKMLQCFDLILVAWLLLAVHLAHESSCQSSIVWTIAISFDFNLYITHQTHFSACVICIGYWMTYWVSFANMAKTDASSTSLGFTTPPMSQSIAVSLVE